MKIKGLFAAVVFMLFSTINLQAQSKPFRIIGYVPSWIDVNTFAQNFDFNQVTHINYAFQNPNADGYLTASNNGLPFLVSKAHEKNVKVLISIGGGSAAGDPIKSNYQNQIISAQKRGAFITKIISYLYQYKLDGLDIDEEGPAINSNYGLFIKQLSDSLKPKGFLLTSAVGWGNENIPNSCLQYFDWINLMAYDLTGSWDQAHPGQHSPYWYAQKMIADWIARGVKRENLTLGLPFYGYGFYNSAGDYGYKTILAKYPEAWKTDQVGDTIYYNGMNTIRNKTKLAYDEISGVMIWELSNDITGDKSLMKVISSYADSLSLTYNVQPTRRQDFYIYPNPANTFLLINHANYSGNGNAQVFNFNGSKLLSVNLHPQYGETSKINISTLSHGLFILKLQTDDGNYTSVFLKN